MTLPFHMSTTDQWFTPRHVVDLARIVLGDIDLDPASCEQANKVIQAKRYFDEAQNGLTKDWQGAQSIFLNPPSGTTKIYRSLPAAFWSHLMAHLGRFGHCIYVAFSISHLQVLQNTRTENPFDFTVCVPKKRLAFYSPSNDQIKSGPPQANAIIYVPSKIDKTQLFKDTFKQLGAVK